MAVFTIDYKSTANLCNFLKKADSELDQSQENRKKICDKISDIRGSQGTHLSTAIASLDAKKKLTSSKINNITEFRNKVLGLTERAAEADGQMAKRISTLSKDFRKTKDIQGNPIINWIILKGTALLNGNDFLKWLKDVVSSIGQSFKEIRSWFRNWYHFDGG